ncbi:hypothetical protein [Thermohalobacter berrensis]|uniref:hypothetical protein n=1 Tax=Thermohalobacter berrensis TaxID=99594 RepID=UPI0015FFC9E4|nr:hypothetical protein [Thermohalobacter berrensis]
MKVKYSENKQEAIITWENNKVYSNTENEEDFVFTFRLIKNKEGIWKVCFLPMQ